MKHCNTIGHSQLMNFLVSPSSPISCPFSVLLFRFLLLFFRHVFFFFILFLCCFPFPFLFLLLSLLICPVVFVLFFSFLLSLCSFCFPFFYVYSFLPLLFYRSTRRARLAMTLAITLRQPLVQKGPSDQG